VAPGGAVSPSSSASAPSLEDAEVLVVAVEVLRADRVQVRVPQRISARCLAGSSSLGSPENSIFLRFGFRTFLNLLLGSYI
jgi:hypothetical protein